MMQSLVMAGLWLAGAALAAALGALLRVALGGEFSPDPVALLRGAHVIAAILWVGLLYFFVFVQAPAVAAATAEKDGPGPSAITRHVTPRALRWFRWASLITWAAGAAHLVVTGQFASVVSLGLVEGAADAGYNATMGLGVWLGTVLLFNVWFFIWPNQKKILGIVKVENQSDIEQAKRTVMTVARINAVISVPTILFMTSAAHGLIV